MPIAARSSAGRSSVVGEVLNSRRFRLFSIVRKEKTLTVENKEKFDDNFQVPINNPIGAGLRGGFQRPRFRGDAPRWLTLLVFTFLLGALIACLLLSL